MSKPEFVIPISQRTDGGSLRTSDLRRVRSTLMAQGFVLLPSDTCYSLAAFAAVDDTHNNINKVLSRGEEPISLCCANYEEALKWIDNSNYPALALLEAFTPGPITVVCSPSERIKDNSRFLHNTIGDPKGKIGIRISDSIVEREVSATNENYLITTVAIRDPRSDQAIISFEKALDIVGKGISAFGQVKWGAIEGRGFAVSHSTVVKAHDNGLVSLLREGAIPFHKIEAAARVTPSTHFDDWG